MITNIRPAIQSDTDRYNVTAACKLLGIHRRTLQKYTEEGHLKVGFLPTGRKFYLGKDILHFWDSTMGFPT